MMVEPTDPENEPETEAQISNREKYEKIKRFYEEARTRDPGLCTYSKDGRFCDNDKIDPSMMGNVICFCVTHQHVLRYALVAFDTPEKATWCAKEKRSQGLNANVWQQKHVVIGPTVKPTFSLSTGGCIGYFEAQMYEDVLMAAMDTLALDLSHIMGRGSRQ